ncbi:MAG: hypothetical protein CENE_03034 [Candidatus Celerinatantimonas neptuna]|nr:MAG: hypothetical protein CENE_03034 [Candidatus Celerinatantimonas neptuna]
MLLRVIAILFPMFSIVLAGYICARRTKINMAVVNRLNLDYFTPALVFGALVQMPLGTRQVDLIAASVTAVLLPGILMWGLCRLCHLDTRVWVPPHMFRNSGNLAIPIFVYTFGRAVMGDAVLMMVVATCLQMSIGILIIKGLDRRGLKQLFNVPVFYATFAALVINLSGIKIWPPLKQAADLLGQSCIPLMLFTLGSQLISLNRSGLKIGLLSTISSLGTGAISFFIIHQFIKLPLQEQQMMVLFTMLPPAVMNYLFAERYKLNSPAVAAMVLYGNFLALFTMPVLLWYALSILH